MARQTTLKGTPLDLEGPELKIGDQAPDVRLKKNLKDDYRLSEGNGSVRLVSVVPSLDTPVCAAQTKRFNQEAGGLPGVQFLTVSMDLPPAQGRFCATEGIDANRLLVLSDHLDGAFGKAFGTLIPALRIECRALFVLDKGGTIRHVEYVKEITDHPDYDAALAALRALG
ncbi:MAG: thiol peroxidase [Phycisphaerae bacterium]|jgi:thiol peroxidase